MMVANLHETSVAASSSDQRKLIAIVYADMTGYSRLIGFDDADTFARLHELRHRLIDPELARNGGTLVNTAGDSLLATFASILSAVRFAIDVQRGVPDLDGDYPPDRRIRFRMAVNVGDVIPDGTNLHGEGVNIAARLQALCPPGGICVTRVVRDYVGNRLGLGFKELGAVELKNIARPTEAFLVELVPSAIPLQPTVNRSRSRRVVEVSAALLVTAALVVALLSVSGLHLWPNTSAPQSEIAQAADSNLPPLSIAVLPFTNLSDDPEQAYLADGIAEDLTTDLSHLDNSFVIARESSFVYRGRSVDVREVGRQLGVRYVLEGSVRKMESRVRITAQLIATDTGAHLWGERFDKSIADLGGGQDDIVARIASALNVRMINLVGARHARAQSGSPAAFDLVMRARSVLLEPVSQDRNFIALGLFLQALRADPNSVPAMAGVAAMFAGPVRGNFDPVKRATDLLSDAEQKAPESPDVLVAKFLLLQRERRNAEAIKIFGRLLEVDPSATGMILQIGLCNCWTDGPAAIPLLKKTIQLNPLSNGVRGLSVSLARTMLLTDSSDEARELLTRTLALPPLPSPTPPETGRDPPGELWRNNARLFLAIADVRSDRIDEAKQVVTEAMTAPSMREVTARSFMRGLNEYEDAALVAGVRRFGEDLRRPGLRDHLDEDADSGVPSTSTMQKFSHLTDPTPMTVPGGRTVRTRDVIDMLATRKPLVLTTTPDVPTIPSALFIDIPATGDLRDRWQDDLGRLMQKLSNGDLHRPIIVFSYNINRWYGRNLALRLIALGYTEVAWYRGGWEAWEASGQPRGSLAGRYNL
jgi:adenylate cyclase